MLYTLGREGCTCFLAESGDFCETGELPVERCCILRTKSIAVIFAGLGSAGVPMAMLELFKETEGSCRAVCMASLASCDGWICTPFVLSLIVLTATTDDSCSGEVTGGAFVFDERGRLGELGTSFSDAVCPCVLFFHTCLGGEGGA